MAMSWLAQQRMGVGKGKGAGTGKGKGSKGKDRRAIAAEIKSNPRWIPAVTNFASTNQWMQKMYPAVTADGMLAEFTREVHEGGHAWDKVADMWTYLEHGEELNRPAFGWSENFSVMRHALGDLMDDLNTPVPMLNLGLKRDLDQVAKRLTFLETLDLGGPNVPRGVAELTDAWNEMTVLNEKIQRQPVNLNFWDSMMRNGLRMYQFAYRVKVMLLSAHPGDHAAKIGNPEKQNPGLQGWPQSPTSKRKQIEFLVKAYLERLNVSLQVMSVPGK